MADESVTTAALPTKTALNRTDSVVVNWSNSSSTNTVIVAVGDFFNSSNLISIAIPNSSPPANSTAAGVKGTVVWDSGFIYLCVATNTWKRATLASF